MATAPLARQRNVANTRSTRWAGPAALFVGLLVAPAALVPPPALAAQEGQIFVRIVDQDGAPVEGATVTASRCFQNPAEVTFSTPATRDCRAIERTTDEKGEATFPSVRIGPRERPYEWWLVATKEGYTSATEVVTLHGARNDIPLTMHEVRSNPTLVRFEDAQAAAEAGDFEAAEEQMAAVVAEMSGRPEGARGRVPRYVQVSALSLLADYRLRLERYEAAEQALDEVLALDPWDRFALRTLVITAAYRQDWAQAEERARDYLAALPANADALLLIGNVYLETGRLPEAIDALEQSELLDPDVAAVHRSLGNAYEMGRRPQDAIRHYQRYLELAGNPADRAQIEEAIARLR